jgi:hypothetical protein
MFILLNTTTDPRKYSPLVCKILDWMSSLFHGMQRLCGDSSYLLETMGLRDGQFPPFGFRIAFPILQPVLLRIRSGRD